jgi:hypothetical protein
MKKILGIAFALVWAHSLTAQETTTETASSGNIEKKTWYVSFGMASFGDFDINKKLQASGMPQLGDAALETTIGHHTMFRKMLIDFEWNTNYMDKKTTTDRIKTINTGFKIRGQYVPFKTENMFFAAGADLSYMFNNFNLYTRGNTIDLDDLNPAGHTGHISLYNQQFWAGPSIAFGAFQKSAFPLRLNVGYEWALYSSKWKSEVAEVANSLKESGQGRFYAKLTLYFD